MKPETPTTTEKGDKSSSPDLLDSVFDNVCPVPDLKCGDVNVKCGENGAVEEKQGTDTKTITTRTMFGRKSSTAADEAEDNFENNAEVEPTPETEAREVAVADMNAESTALEKLAAKFEMDCCAKNTAKQPEEAEVPVALEDGKDKADDRSLTDIAAKMNEIDLESQNTENDDSLDQDVTKQDVTAFYKEPFYATLIALSGCMIIAIIVMSVLIAKK